MASRVQEKYGLIYSYFEGNVLYLGQLQPAYGANQSCKKQFSKIM